MRHGIYMGTHMNENSAGRILNSFRRIVRYLRIATRGAEKDLGLSAAQLYVLQCLGTKPGLSINGLADRTHTHQSSVSTVVARLEKQGMISRNPDPEDRRQTRLTLTQAGQAVLERAPETAQEKILRAIGALPEPDQAALARMLEQVLHAAGLDAEPAEFFFEDRPDELS